MRDRRGAPAYRQVASTLRERITAGVYAPGESLPSERELVDTFEVSRPTIREALGLLRSEGLVIAEHGRGVFVRPPLSIQRLARSRLSRAARAENRGAFLADAEAGGWTPSSSVKVRFEHAADEVAAALEIDSGTEVTVRDRAMRADGLVVQLATSYIPRDLTRGTAIEQVETGTGGMHARLEEAGHTLVRFAERVGTRMPSPDEVSLMGLPDGVPILTVARVAYSTERPLEINYMRLAGDRYELDYEWAAE